MGKIKGGLWFDRQRMNVLVHVNHCRTCLSMSDFVSITVDPIVLQVFQILKYAHGMAIKKRTPWRQVEFVPSRFERANCVHEMEVTCVWNAYSSSIFSMMGFRNKMRILLSKLTTPVFCRICCKIVAIFGPFNQ